MAPPSLPAAVLWDMDGTLVDTEPYWMRCEHALAAKYGGRWSTEDALAVVGGDLVDSATYMREHMGIDRTPAQIVEELLDGVVELVQQEVPWRPGARELLADLGTAGVPCALVTMSYRRFAEPVVGALPAGSFAALVLGDEVNRGKPHPEPYLRGAELLGVAPERTVAIEDSPTGAASAEAAGCRVLVVPHHVDVPDGPRRVRRDTLAGLTPVDLGALLDGHVVR
ncbi:HAD superfamily hydrolase (TIGR01509 family) [Nocardioides aurantiacus]|uniref:HAD superfamily hydrolase (TIGR01509 family) n=1 Tax=Nocardioides aurantiacus TaxID=86796 RepID=A0A3N2CTC8_9ACTN|nr:HAD family phosphatase [Nocardioides aurantiacus]ROR90706.1 HAD superfamily hydrolase (TIGR01509 family) [Nocardioides aurantiacus]